MQRVHRCRYHRLHRRRSTRSVAMRMQIGEGKCGRVKWRASGSYGRVLHSPGTSKYARDQPIKIRTELAYLICTRDRFFKGSSKEIEVVWDIWDMVDRRRRHRSRYRVSEA